jgi:hypothetical protein
MAKIRLEELTRKQHKEMHKFLNKQKVAIRQQEWETKDKTYDFIRLNI